MKKCRCLALVVILLACAFTSCETNDSLALDAACFYASVPGFYERDLRRSAPELVEEDAYGRRLLYYRSYNDISNLREVAYVICQKAEDSTVYFYEDINYIRMEYKERGKAESLLVALKEKNDWNLPFNAVKCSVREVKITLNGFNLVNDAPDSLYYRENLYSTLEQTYGITEQMIATHDFYGWDGKKCALHYILLLSGERYFCILDTSANLQARRIENVSDFSEELRALKQNSGWHYGP